MKLDNISEYFREKKEQLQDFGDVEYLKRLYVIRHKINKEINIRKNKVLVHGNLIREAIRNKARLSVYRHAFFKYFSQIKFRHFVAAPFIHTKIPHGVSLGM